MTDRIAPRAERIRYQKDMPDGTEHLDWVPSEQTPPDFSSLQHGLEQTYHYRWENGETACYVARLCDAAQSKSFRPVTLWRHRDGKAFWYMVGMPGMRPLYNLPDLANRPDAIVLLSEGEKCADAAKSAFPAYASVTWMGGTQSINKTDFAPLSGKRVVILPDHDEPGAKAAEQLKAVLKEVGAAQVCVIDPGAIASKIGVEAPKGWDVADAIDTGFEQSDLDALIAEALPSVEIDIMPSTTDAVKADDHPDQVEDKDFCPEPTEVDEDPDFQTEWEKSAFATFQKLSFLKENFVPEVDQISKSDVDRLGRPILTFVCSPVVILGRTVIGSSGSEWGFLLGVLDPLGKWKSLIVPARLLAGDGKELREILASHGVKLPMDRAGRQALMEYIGWAANACIVLVAKQPGWHGDHFVLPDQTISPPGAESEVILDLGAREHFLSTAGSPEKWQQLAQHAERNSRIAFVIMMALAAPLLKPLGHQGGGVHLFGQSSRGKTTMLVIAGSVWGGGGNEGMVRSWRMTSNGAEGTCYDHNDLILMLDELTTVKPEDAQELYYMLANGKGKGRAKKDGSSQNSSEWRAMVLSSGENTAEHQLSSGRSKTRVTGGLAVRMVDVPLEVSEGQSFEDIGAAATPAQFADRLAHIAKTHYGHAGRKFVGYLQEDREKRIKTGTDHARRVHEMLISPEDDPQVQRVAKRFAIIAAAGHLAIEGGILPWAPESVDAAVQACFQAWRSHRGGGVSEEKRSALKHLKVFFQMHGSTRFERMRLVTANNGQQKGHDQQEQDVENTSLYQIRDCCGFRREQEDGSYIYYVYPEAWEQEVCGDHDADLMLSVAADHGALELGEGNRKKKNQRLPGNPRPTRVVAIQPHLLG